MAAERTRRGAKTRAMKVESCILTDGFFFDGMLLERETLEDGKKCW